MKIGLEEIDHKQEWLSVKDTDIVLLIGQHNPLLHRIVLTAPEVLFIDTRGISAEILPYCTNVNDTIYFCARDTQFPIAFNPLYSSKSHDDIASEILFTFKSIFNMKHTPQFDMTMLGALKATLANPNPSFLRMYTLLTSQHYRQTLHHTDPFIENFFKWFDSWEDREKFQRTMSTINKLFELLNHNILRNILNQPNKLQFTNKTVLADLSEIPRQVQRLLGSLLLNHSSRVVVTDAHLFAIPERDSMFLEYKHLPKLDYSTLVVVRARGKDIKDLAEELQILPHDLKKAGSVWVLTDDYQTHSVIIPEHNKQQHNKTQKIVDQTRRRYCTPKDKVSDDLAMFITEHSPRRTMSRGTFRKRRTS